MNAWDQHYRDGWTPWDTNGRSDAVLAQLVAAGTLPPGRALEVGCGRGANARFLAARGWDVLGVDVSPTAVDEARALGGGVRYAVHDILAEPVPDGPFDVVLDRGCFHVFDGEEDRARFAARVADALRPGGCWLSFVGSTEGPGRDRGPPRRSVRDLAAAIEPVLEILELRSAAFVDDPGTPLAWVCLSRRRLLPAQPSTRR